MLDAYREVRGRREVTIRQVHGDEVVVEGGRVSAQERYEDEMTRRDGDVRLRSGSRLAVF